MHWLSYFNALLLTIVLFSTGRLHADEAQIKAELTAKGASFALWGVSVENESQWTEADFRKLAQLRSLTWIWFNKGLQDGQLKILEDMPDVRSFQSSNGMLSDEGLKSLATFHKLQSLRLWNPGNTMHGAGFAALATLPELQDLSIDGSHALNNEGMAAIAKLSHLKSLAILNSPVDPRSWAWLANLTALKTLILGNHRHTPTGPALSGGTLDGILPLTNLEQVGLIGVDMSLKELERLKQLPHLKVISLDDAKISNDDLYQLRADLASVRIEHSKPTQFNNYILW